MIIAIVQLFQNAHYAVAVLCVHLYIGNFFQQHPIQLGRFQLFQRIAVGEIGFAVAHHIAVGHGCDVQPRAAHDHRQLSARQDILDRPIRQLLKIVHGKEIARAAHIDQMMANAAHFLRRDLAAAQIEAAEHLPGIRGNDFGVVFFRQRHAQRALAGSVRSGDDDQFRFVHAFALLLMCSRKG